MLRARDELHHAYLSPSFLQCANLCRFDFLTVENAIRLFDTTLTRVVLRKDELQPAALACLFVSSKLHETKALSFDIVQSHFRGIISVPQLMTYEHDILTAVNWDTSTFTSVQFVLAVTLLITDPQMLKTVRDTALHMLRAIALPREYAALVALTLDCSEPATEDTPAVDLPTLCSHLTCTFLLFVAGYDVALMDPCHVGLAVVSAACKYRSLQYESVVQSLNDRGIPIVVSTCFLRAAPCFERPGCLAAVLSSCV